MPRDELAELVEPGFLVSLFLVRILKTQVLPRAQVKLPDRLKAWLTFAAKPEIVTHALMHDAPKRERGLRPGGNLGVIGIFEFQRTFPVGLDPRGAELELAVGADWGRQARPSRKIRM